MVGRRTRRWSIPLHSSLANAAVFLYFLTLVLHNMFGSTLIRLCWYAVLTGCFFVSIFSPWKGTLSRTLLFIFLYAFSGLANYAFVGNNGISHLIYTFFYLGIYVLLSDKSIAEKAVAVAIYINCFLLAGMILRTGWSEQVLLESSNNYISVLLFLPLFVYYVRLEHKGKPVSLFPAVSVWVVCLLAQGRGGILVSTIFLGGLSIANALRTQGWKSMRQRKCYRRHLITFWVCLSIMTTLLFSRIMDSVIMARFNEYGMYGTGRGAIWGEYIQHAFAAAENFWWGVQFDSLFQMIRYKNNLHNSFLNVHAFNGIMMLLYLFISICASLFLCLKKRKWISALCIVAFFLRSFTDKIFWGGLAGTPVMFFLLWYPVERNIRGEVFLIDEMKRVSIAEVRKARVTEYG